MRVRERGQVVAEIPTGALTDDAPVYKRPMETPAYLEEVQKLSLPDQPAMSDADALRALLASPTIASKRWVYRQYDHMVRTNTLVLPGMGAGVVRVKGTDRALALSVDGNGRYCYLDPYRGAILAVVEAARNVACAGGEPIGATNCLNFGNPERPEIMWQFGRAVEGITAACKALDIPITGRQRQPLQRDRREGDLSDAGSGRRRSHRGCQQGARPQLQGERRCDRAARRDPSRARRQRISEGDAAPRRRRASRRRSCTPRRRFSGCWSRPRAKDCFDRRTTAPRAAWR